MDFAEARTAFFEPRDTAVADSPATPSAARRLRDALEPIAMIDLWSDAAGEHLAAAGLDFLTYYVGGRAGLLGDVQGRVAAAAFGVFEPGLVGDLWTAARAIAPVAELRAIHERAAGEALRTALADAAPAEVDAVVDLLHPGIDAADLAGRPLFAGLLAAGWPDDPYARLWRAASLLREYRGDTHLAACSLAGLTGLEANVLTELWVGYGLLEYTATRGWSQESMDAAVAHLTAGGLLADGALTEEGAGLRAGIEDVTDRAAQAVLDAIGSGVDTVVAAVTPWSDAIVARGWFPPDPYKRAAG